MAVNTNSMSKSRYILGNILVYLAGILLVGSSLVKFAHISKVTTQLAAIGFGGEKLTIIAVLEILSAVLFLARPLRAAGLLLASAYMGGAIAAHMAHGDPILQPAFVLVLLWLGAWLRHPGLLWSLPEPSVQATQPAASAAPGNLQRRAWSQS